MLLLFASGFLMLFTPSVVAVGEDIDYNFENDYLYNGSLPESTNDFNVRNKTAGHYNGTYSFENETGL